MVRCKQGHGQRWDFSCGRIHTWRWRQSCRAGGADKPALQPVDRNKASTWCLLKEAEKLKPTGAGLSRANVIMGEAANDVEAKRNDNFQGIA